MAPMPFAFEEELLILMSGLLSSVPSMLFSIATYVLTALAIYTIARRRGLNKPWLAWVPVVNCWLLGSLSDQYQYVVKGENKSKRKWLLMLSILMSVLTIVIVVLIAVTVGTVIFSSYRYDSEIFTNVLGPVMGMAGLSLPLSGIAIAYAVIRYMALYDVFRSLDPANSVLFLVMSILFGVTEPFFLFFNRNKDQGMPPRRQENVYTQVPVQEPWEQENKDYL